jgi:hypothetical protein
MTPCGAASWPRTAAKEAKDYGAAVERTPDHRGRWAFVDVAGSPSPAYGIEILKVKVAKLPNIGT